MQCYVDANDGNCPDTRRSVSGYCIFLGSNLISWRSKKQSTVSRSSAEAEYRSMGASVAELLWISYLLHDLQLKLALPISLWCDNQAAIQITANAVYHERTKHLEIDCHFIRHHYRSRFIHPRHVPSKQQVANLFTKALPNPVHSKFVC